MPKVGAPSRVGSKHLKQPAASVGNQSGRGAIAIDSGCFLLNDLWVVNVLASGRIRLLLKVGFYLFTSCTRKGALKNRGVTSR